MIGVLIGLFAFFISGAATFGGDLIYTLEVMETWYQIVLGIISFIVSILLILIMAGGGVEGAKHGKVGALFGTFLAGGVGMIVGVLFVGITILQLVIIDWLLENISPGITGFDGVTSKQAIGLVALVAIPIVMNIYTHFTKTKSE